MRPNRKPLIIGILCFLVTIMAVGFALFSENLTIIGSTSNEMGETVYLKHVIQNGV